MIEAVSDEHLSVAVQRQVMKLVDVSETRQQAAIHVHFTHLHTQRQIYTSVAFNDIIL